MNNNFRENDGCSPRQYSRDSHYHQEDESYDKQFYDGRGKIRKSRGGNSRTEDHPQDHNRDVYHGGRRKDEHAKDKKRRCNEYDNFGASERSRSSSTGGGMQNRSKRRKKTWPPHFPDDANAYVFDARSGLFYDAMSDFFYDPKTKLYYGNEKKIYYEYCSDEGAKPRFREVDHHNNEGLTAPGMMSATTQGNDTLSGGNLVSSGQDLVVQALQGGSAMTGNKKKSDGKNKIAICLKKKPSGGVGGASTITPSKPASASADDSAKSLQAHKKHKADMEKWTERGKEMRGHSANGGKDISFNAPNNALEASTLARNSMGTEVKRTPSGKPICMLCRRKFADVDKLRQHEQLSSLHKKNLAMKRKLQQKKTEVNAANAPATDLKESSTVEYRDRAKERRSMVNLTSTSSVPNLKEAADIAEMGPSLSKARRVTTTETVIPSQSLGEKNIGNQLLQKLGWKKGSLLGRNGISDNNEHIINPADGENFQANIVADKLKQDWERIESLAGSGNGIGARKYG